MSEVLGYLCATKMNTIDSIYFIIGVRITNTVKKQIIVRFYEEFGEYDSKGSIFCFICILRFNNEAKRKQKMLTI